MNSRLMIGTVVLVGGVIFVAAEAAPVVGFTGPYDPANWTTSSTGSGTQSGSVNTAGAPASITLNSSSDGNFNFNSANNTTDYTIAAVISGPVSFDYAYTEGSTFGSTTVGDAGTLLNGVYTPIAFDNGDSGSFSFNVNAGDDFGFRARTSITDSDISNSFTISNFSANSSQVPEPVSVLIWSTLGTAVIVTGLVRRRQRAARKASDSASDAPTG